MGISGGGVPIKVIRPRIPGLVTSLNGGVTNPTGANGGTEFSNSSGILSTGLTTVGCTTATAGGTAGVRGTGRKALLVDGKTRRGRIITGIGSGATVASATGLVSDSVREASSCDSGGNSMEADDLLRF